MPTTLISPAISLPAGYTARPAQLSDAPAAVALFNASSQALLGVNQHELTDVEQDWQNPDFHLATDSCALFTAGGTLVGFGSLWDSAPHVNPEQWGRVHPAHTGRGLGTYLVSWAEARAQQSLAQAPANVRVILTDWVNSRDSAALDLLRAFGHTHVRSAWRMVIDLADEAPPPAPVLPPGVSLRSFVLGQDDEATVHTVRACFSDHWGHVERPFAEELEGWRHNWQTNPNFDASLWTLAVSGAGTPAEQIVGTSFAREKMNEDPGMGWIFSLGVRREWRRQGLAQALLHDSFGRLYARGQRRVGLGVDAGSLTGATRLYEKAGMRADPNYTYEVWEKELRAGADLATSALTSH